MTNSVDPDQTAPSGAVWSGSALFVYAILSAILVFEILEIYHTYFFFFCFDIIFYPAPLFHFNPL